MGKHETLPDEIDEIDDAFDIDDEDDMPTSEEIQKLYELIAERDTSAALELCWELFHKHGDLPNPRTQLRLASLRSHK